MEILQNCTAVLGGSFDPIHLGHLHIARQILIKSPVSKVLFIPCNNHNFKKDRIYLDFASRFDLVSQAIASEPAFEISAADSEGSGYTAHLMQRLQAQNPRTNYVFVIGSDNLPGLANWFDFNWLQSNLRFLILPRPGFELQERYLHGIDAFILDIELSPISSTQIRERISRGESIHGLVPDKLERRIGELYRKK